ncbi:hypothetical protein G6N82_01135 [Altererythrobacter sp. BO-6]|uniref:CAP domain-containing protein n=1 Tax=Altererythrobacter sp. BO-6 TaxID=2604537 RepID=UPI0013E1F5D4|nr:CAP domain-containing protein [Altererythrobacter sp. BO-6]QIG52951.1 hypothetical protein G6N82_01135 [Altererythrobacter sp. BO-6]
MARRSLGASLIALTLVLAGCGGGDSPASSSGNLTAGLPSPTPSPSPTPVPTPSPTPTPTPPPTGGTTTGQDQMLQVMLAEHNRERRTLGIPDLVLDPDLNRQALAYAQEMAVSAVFAHSPSTSRPGQGENLWAGTASRFSHQSMVGAWIGEKQYYLHDRFPYVSSTGNWQDVGHYTQIIWRSTTRLGCGLATGGNWDYLVCRYAPPGNVSGQYAY